MICVPSVPIHGYWLAHRLLKSRARAYYSDIYNIPDENGQFKWCSWAWSRILRESFYALAQTARLSRGRDHHHPGQAPRDRTFVAFSSRTFG
jgi:hypothetical protein